jgi:cytochrome c peroxidase
MEPIMKRLVLPLLFLGLAQPAFAETPQQMMAGYAAEAARAQAGFSPSAERGRQFYAEKRSATEKMPSCTTCHTDDPATVGKHVITSKPIEPMAPVAGSTRFTDAAKTEKWFRRNCKEVVGRECTPGEKADLLRFLLTRAGA